MAKIKAPMMRFCCRLCGPGTFVRLGEPELAGVQHQQGVLAVAAGFGVSQIGRCRTEPKKHSERLPHLVPGVQMPFGFIRLGEPEKKYIEVF